MDEHELRQLESAAMEAVSTALRDEASKLPPESEIRALMLRSANRYALSAAGELGRKFAALRTVQ